MFFKERMSASKPIDSDFIHLGWGVSTGLLKSSPGDWLSQGWEALPRVTHSWLQLWPSCRCFSRSSRPLRSHGPLALREKMSDLVWATNSSDKCRSMATSGSLKICRHCLFGKCMKKFSFHDKHSCSRDKQLFPHWKQGRGGGNNWEKVGFEL